MKLANATNLYRKSGGAQRSEEPALSEVEGDLRFMRFVRGKPVPLVKILNLDKCESQPSPSTSSGQALRDSIWGAFPALSCSAGELPALILVCAQLTPSWGKNNENTVP